MSETTSIQDKLNEIIDKHFPAELFKEAGILNKLIKNTFGIKCKKCGSDNVNEKTVQTRSADEISTIFYECINCGFKWRG